jgi:hypothetical protein
MTADYLGLVKSWADGVYTFRLRLGELRSLDARFKMGPQYLALKIDDANGTIDEITETIRLGLIGGGTDAAKAAQLVDDYIIRPSRINTASQLAAEILAAHLIGEPEEDLPKPKAPADSNENESNSQTAVSPSENTIPQ